MARKKPEKKVSFGAVLGKKCCNNECLKKLTNNNATNIYNRFCAKSRNAKYAKLREFLQASKQPVMSIENSLDGHLIGGGLYVLRFEIETSRYIYLCPSAFKALVRVGMSTLERLCDENAEVGTVHHLVQTSEATKLENCIDWFNKHIKPLCTEDEFAPTCLRCDAYAEKTVAYRAYSEYLREKYPADDKQSFCSPSTFNTAMHEFSGSLLWGEGGFCGECFTYEKHADEAKKRGDAAEAKKWQDAKKEHKKVAQGLRAFASQCSYDSFFTCLHSFFSIFFFLLFFFFFSFFFLSFFIFFLSLFFFFFFLYFLLFMLSLTEQHQG
jgi:hypothetical protein